MKRKFLAALVVVGSLALGACQEDPTMDELIEDIELNASEPVTTGGGSGDDDNPPGGN